jgi:hypothetical protein
MSAMRRVVTLLTLLLTAALLADCDEECEGNLDELAAWCPKTFDGTAAQLPHCMDGSNLDVRVCGDLIVLSRDRGTQTCDYDAYSHQLVGAGIVTDYAMYCDGKSNVLKAGKADLWCGSAVKPIVQKDCSVRAEN